MKGKMMLSEQQRLARKLGIGGSDSAVILGLSPYKTPYQLYLEKIGDVEYELPQNQPMYWGNALEAIIREEFSKRNNVVVEQPETLYHPDHPFIFGNIDGFIKESNAILEIKTCSGFIASQWGEPGTDQIPLQYLVQIAHYCAVAQTETAHIAVLIGGNDYREYRYTRDAAIEKKILQSCIDFWQCVQTRTPPSPVNIEDLRLLYPEPIPAKVAALKDGTDFDELVSIKSRIKLLAEREEELKLKVMSFMQDAEVLACATTGEILATWKANKKGNRTFLMKTAQ